MTKVTIGTPFDEGNLEGAFSNFVSPTSKSIAVIISYDRYGRVPAEKVYEYPMKVWY